MISVQSAKREKILAFVAVAVLITVSAAGFYYHNYDLYFMYKHGEYILKNGFPVTEPFTLHQGFRFSIEKWLSCLIFFGLHEAFGYKSIVILGVCISILLGIMVFLYTMEISHGRFFPSIMLSIAVMGLSALGRQTRPQIFTFLIVVTELFIVERSARKGSSNLLFLLIPMAWLEMQLHSTQWPIFFIVIIPYLFDIKLRGLEKEVFQFKKKLLIVIMLSFGVLFINPYGAWSVSYIFRSYGHANMNVIGEVGAVAFGANMIDVLAFTIIFSFLIGKRKCPLRYAFMAYGLILFGLSANRNIYFTEIFAFPVCAYYFRKIDEEKALKKINNRDFAILICFSIFFAACILYHNIDFNNKAAIEMDKEHSLAAVDYIVEDGGEGKKIFNSFDIGSYADYRGLCPYIDTRAEVFFKSVNGKKDIFNEYIKLKNGKIDCLKFFKKYDFDYIIADSNDSFYYLDKITGGYEMIYDKKHTKIFKKMD